MEIVIPIFLFILGIVIIIKGGDIFVDGAVWVAKVTGIPNIIIGATIVSLATTLPELFVSVIASIEGSPDIAIGNAVGSIICNIGLILAIYFIFMPGKVEKKSFKSKAFIMLCSLILVMFFSIDKIIKPYEGIVLLAVLIYYIYLNLKEAKESRLVVNEELAVEIESTKKIEVSVKEILKNISMFIIGAIFIVIGAKLLVNNAQIIAKYFNVPESIISLTVVAIGTSLPELVTAISSIIKKENGVAIGNILGANILNATMILGTCSIISKGGLPVSSGDITVFNNTFFSVPQSLYIDIPIALILMLLLMIPIMKNGKSNKHNGIALLGVYVIYIIFLATLI